MKSLTTFLQNVLEDLGTWCRTSTIRDLQTVTDRYEHEGLSFLTITLPEFGRDFEKSLDLGQVSHDSFAGFRRSRGLPRFMGGFLEDVFDRNTGRLLDCPSIDAIWAIRQFSLMWAKMEIDCTPKRVRSALDGYIECEWSVREADQSLGEDESSRFSRIAALLWGRVLNVANQQIYDGEIVPRHGPGNTAEKLRGNAKWTQLEWTQRLEQVFPHWEHLVTGWSLYDRLDRVRVHEPGAERPVRVVTVPKTLKTPRIIALEPTCMQYMQQGLLEAIGQAVEADDIARQLIGWQSQVPNQRLALEGSRNGTLATLDLSEASDRVSNQHVRSLLRNHSYLAAAVDATRSRKADVPGHGVIRLAKFASMGSALCFPMESMVFMTIIFMGIEQELSRPLTKKDVKSFLGSVRTYGDDIIVPTRFVRAVISNLEAFGLKVNLNKSFWTGKFRESCGSDSYDGVDVSIVKLRAELPTDRKHASEIVSTVSTMNQLYWAGMWKSADYLASVVEKLIPLPYVGQQSPILGRTSALGLETIRWACPDLHVPFVKGYRVRSRIPASPLDDYGALIKCLVKKGSNPIFDPRHLERAGRDLAVRITPSWGPAY